MLRRAERAAKRSVGSLFRALLRSGKRPVIDLRGVRSVLVVRQHNQLGDMLCAVPLLRTLRQQLPSSRIILITSPVNHEVMLHNRFVDEIILFDKSTLTGGGVPRPGALASFIRGVRDKRCDCAIVPATVSTSFTSDMLAYLSGAPVRIGCAGLNGKPSPSSFFFNIPVDLDWRSDPARHQTLRNMDVLLGFLPPGSDLSSEITLTEHEKEQGAAMVKGEAGGNASVNVAFHPGAGKLANRWPAERFAAVAEITAAEFGAAVFITAGPMDDEPVATMEKGLNVRRHVIRNRSIRQVAALLAAMDLVVSNDTGIMHVAAAVGVPVLSLFGPTDPGQWAPSGPIHRSIRGEGGRVDSIRVEEVVGNIRRMLRGKPSRVLA